MTNIYPSYLKFKEFFIDTAIGTFKCICFKEKCNNKIKINCNQISIKYNSRNYYISDHCTNVAFSIPIYNNLIERTIKTIHIQPKFIQYEFILYKDLTYQLKQFKIILKEKYKNDYTSSNQKQRRTINNDRYFTL